MSDEKYDLDKGLKAMRYVAKMLNTWADDLETSGRPGCVNGADGQAEAVGMTPERREALEKVLDEAVGANETELVSAESAPEVLAAPAPAAEPIKFEQVQHAMTVLCAMSLRPRVEALVLSYGVCLSVIPKEKYAELMAAAEEMAKEAGIDLFGGDGHG